MASVDPLIADPLHRLRESIAINSPPIATTSAESTSQSGSELSLAVATHLFFPLPTPQSFPLDTPTRFVSSDKPVDLRSIYFAWLKRDVPIPDYIASAQRLSEELLASGSGGKVQNLVFVEKLDLITWLEGAADESEYIKPLATGVAAARVSGQPVATAGIAGGITPAASGTFARGAKVINPRLAVIYNGERKMGDRNSILRGIKPTEFSHIRKTAETFLGRTRNKQGQPVSSTSAPLNPNPALVSLPKKRGGRPDPIILLSPSASSLLRMSNIKTFLETGTYVPADSALAGSSNTASILHISRLLPSIDSTRPLRFILVDTPEQFKPDYWSRVVGVFTTGQTWQFKSYKWQSPAELFRNALGIYVGWRGEDVPDNVRGWGRGVMTTAIEKWNNNLGTQGRWRDREVVEGIWGSIEESMKSRGWGKDGGPAMR